MSHQRNSSLVCCVQIFFVLLLFCTLATIHSKLARVVQSELPSVRPHEQDEAASFEHTDVSRPTLLKQEVVTASGQRKLYETEEENGSGWQDDGEEVEMERDAGAEAETEGDMDVEEDMENGMNDEAEDEDELEDVEREEEVAGTGIDEHGKSESSSELEGMRRDLENGTTNERMLVDSVDYAVLETNVEKRLGRLGKIKMLPRWDPLEDVGMAPGQGRWQHTQGLSHKHVNPKLPGLEWDHLLGVVRKTNVVRERSPPLTGQLTWLDSRKVNLGAQKSAQVLFENGQGRSMYDTIDTFSSDDEPLDQNVLDKLQEVRTIEDALLLNSDKGKKLKKERPLRGPFDPLNPANNALLQDPDTPGPSGLNINDKAVLKALRRARVIPAMSGVEAEEGSAKGRMEGGQGNLGANPSEKTMEASHVHESKSIVQSVNSRNGDERLGNLVDRSILEVSNTDLGRHHHTKKKQHVHVDKRRWGFYPGLDPHLGFSEFMDQFLGNKRCSHRVFMAWTTPPWTYTTRYQRGLESLLYFHPQACVVVFSETIELNFFRGLVDEGFRVAVVVPNLEELLYETPADIFASVWLSWRKTNLFHIHYTELLRLAALYKYGGLYLDTDVILLKPLDNLHNTIGAEEMDHQGVRLNGAVMAFDKFSPFLLGCLDEFRETYDDQLFDFNGAGLVTRVMNRTRTARHGTQSDWHSGRELRIEQLHAFFPISSNNITRYFKAPESKEEQTQDDFLFERVCNHSRMLHFWNQRTQRLVPQGGSLVERILNRHCIKCNEYL